MGPLRLCFTIGMFVLTPLIGRSQEIRSRPPTPPEFFDLCDSETVAAATVKGDRLGWQRASEEETRKWRERASAYTGEVTWAVSWYNGSVENGDILSFWTMGSDRVCAYYARDISGFMDALTAKFGLPKNRYESRPLVTMTWQRGKSEVYYVDIGSTKGITILQRY